MDPNRLTLAEDEFNAHVLLGVMGATGQPGETAQDAQTRCAAIVELFRSFEPADPVEAMMACHCIALHFMLAAAMRDANAGDLEPAMLIRMRASAISVGKSLDLWMRNFTGRHAFNEARAIEGQRVSQSAREATQPNPQSAPVQSRRGQSQSVECRSIQSRSLRAGRSVAEQPVRPALPLVASAAGAVAPASGMADLPVQSSKQALLSSAAVSQGGASNGRLTAATPAPGS